MPPEHGFRREGGDVKRRDWNRTMSVPVAKMSSHQLCPKMVFPKGQISAGSHDGAPPRSYKMLSQPGFSPKGSVLL